MRVTFLDVYIVLVKKQGRLRCSTFVLLLQHMKAFIHQKLMLCTYCCVRELGRSYSRSIVGIVNCKTYIRNSRRNRPAILQLMIGLKRVLKAQT